MRKLIQTLVATAALAGLVAQATAAPVVCGTHDVIVKALTERYKEIRESLGISSSGNLTEVYVSGTGSWTILVTTQKGLTCIVSTGQRWNGLTPASADKPA